MNILLTQSNVELINLQFVSSVLSLFSIIKIFYIMANSKITQLLGNQSEYLLNHKCKTVDKSLLHTTGPMLSIIYGLILTGIYLL